MKAQDFRLVYITCKDQNEAKHLSQKLLEHRLVACTNILGEIASFYWWKGRIQNELEVTLIAKSRKDKVDDLIKMTKKHHSYQCPCIVTLELQEGNPDYLTWLEEQLSEPVT